MQCHMADRSSVDPWFNFRATKYLVQHGFYNFWDWFDDRKPSRRAKPPERRRPKALPGKGNSVGHSCKTM